MIIPSLPLGAAEYAVGIALALGVSGFARAVGFDRDRSFYPAVAVVVASYYVLFAAMGGSGKALALELLIMAAFVLVAVLGFRRNLWLVVACLAAHGVLDSFHDSVVTNLGVPRWWPGFCLAFDVGAALALAYVQVRRKARTAHTPYAPRSPALSARSADV